MQRRHQKLIEESPAPGLSAQMRREMGESAVRLAEAVDYVGAGTVEFLVEGDKFYFLEMNTRIQVEHPVTELVHGVDLIAEQIRVADGAELSIMDRLQPVGAAVEARINAEDVAGGLFLPAPGLIANLSVPAGDGIRFDAGYEGGDEVLPYYDSLVGKLIAYGRDREQAIERLIAALRGIRIEGVETTVPAALAVLGHEDFQKTRFNTLWLESTVDFSELDDDRQEVEVGGRYYLIPTFSDYGDSTGYRSAEVQSAGVATASSGRKASSRRSAAANDGSIKAPMQGTIVKVNVAAGDQVSKGDVLFVLEAMKMENPLTAPFDGMVGEIAAEIGQSLAAGTVLTTVEALVTA